MKVKRTHANNPARAKYRALGKSRDWRVIEGAVVDAIRTHPEMVTELGMDSLSRSVTKRVIGAMKSLDWDCRPASLRQAAENEAQGPTSASQNATCESGEREELFGVSRASSGGVL